MKKKVETRVCRTCGKEFPLTKKYFYMDRAYFKAHCKKCDIIRSLKYLDNKSYYKNNVEKFKKKAKEWKKDNPEKWKIQVKKSNDKKIMINKKIINIDFLSPEFQGIFYRLKDVNSKKLGKRN